MTCTYNLNKQSYNLQAARDQCKSSEGKDFFGGLYTVGCIATQPMCLVLGIYGFLIRQVTLVHPFCRRHVPSAHHSQTQCHFGVVLLLGRYHVET